MNTPATATIDLRVSVAILTCNRKAKLAQCLELVAAQLLDDDEIVVLDTGSTDGTREWLAEQESEIIRVFNFDEARCDFAMARNRLVQECHNEIVVFLDDDCYPQTCWLDLLRHGVADGYDAVGGIVLPHLPTLKLPRWWGDDIGWTAGMSSRGVWLRHDDCYPATANMAVRRDVLLQHPFCSTMHDFASGDVYFAGREDAHWWLAARRNGLRLRIEPEAVVLHDVEQERLTLRRVLRRAFVDGQTTFAREANAEWETAAVNDVGRVLLRLPQIAFSPIRRFPEVVWGVRQLGLVKASGNLKRIPCGFARAFISSAKSLTAKAVSRTMKLCRGSFAIPENPKQILIVSPSYLGDAVLLQAATRQLAHTLPTMHIEVITPYTEVFENLPANVRVFPLNVLDDATVIAGISRRAEVVFVPYWHRMSTKAWHCAFSAKGICFSEDVGFARQFDYLLARKTVRKKFRQNEALNLSRLLNQWGTPAELHPPALTGDREVLAEMLRKHPQLAGGDYALLQVDTAQAMKAWPAERWAQLAQVLAARGLRIGLLSGEPNDEAYTLISHQLGTDCVADLGGCSIRELIAILSGCRVAVGGCSGPKHLAYALRVPTFTVYGPMKPERWGPLADRAIHGFVETPVPYLTPREMAGLPANWSMLQVSADRAAAALEVHLTSLGL